MTKRNQFLLIYFLYVSLLFLTPLRASPPSQTDDEELSTLLSPDEQTLVEKEATQQEQNEASQGDADSEESLANAEELASQEEDQKCKEEEDKKYALKKYKNNSRYSRSGSSVNRYNLERRTPGAALKSTPSQRSFGN